MVKAVSLYLVVPCVVRKSKSQINFRICNMYHIYYVKFVLQFTKPLQYEGIN